LALLFEAGKRPAASDVVRHAETLSEAPGFGIAHCPPDAEGWIELLSMGLSFDCLGLKPAKEVRFEPLYRLGSAERGESRGIFVQRPGDPEHGTVLAQLRAVAAGADGEVPAVLVRPAATDAVTIRRLLDLGVQTLLAPMVSSGSEAPAIVAPMLGTQMLALIPRATEAKVPLVTVSGTAKITELGSAYVFRFFPGDAVGKAAQARYTVEELKAKRPALL